MSRGLFAFGCHARRAWNPARLTTWLDIGSDGVPGEVELIALKKGEFLSGR